MTDTFHLYLNGRRALCRRQSGLPWKRLLVELPEWSWNSQDPASLAFSLPDADKRRRAPLHVYLGSALCKFMIVEIAEGVVDVRERGLIAEARMRRHLGLDPEEWRCTVDVGKKLGKAIVCAIHSDLMARIEALATLHGLKLVSLRPYASGLWNMLSGSAHNMSDTHTGLLAVEDDAFTVFLAQSGALISMNALMHNGEPDLVERELKRIGLSAGPQMREGIRLALSNEFARKTMFDRERMLDRQSNQAGILACDFRDLLLEKNEVT